MIAKRKESKTNAVAKIFCLPKQYFRAKCKSNKGISP